jgi:hypothetical protein
MLPPLQPRGMSPQYILNMRLGGPQTVHAVENTKSLPNADDRGEGGTNYWGPGGPEGSPRPDCVAWAFVFLGSIIF